MVEGSAVEVVSAWSVTSGGASFVGACLAWPAAPDRGSLQLQLFTAPHPPPSRTCLPTDDPGPDPAHVEPARCAAHPAASAAPSACSRWTSRAHNWPPTTPACPHAATMEATANNLTAQLQQARDVVLNNPANYPVILPSILPIIGHNTDVAVRRWGAEFLAETFASPLLPDDQKQQLSLLVLDKLREFLDQPQEDVAVTKAVVQAAASIYPLVFRYM